MSEAIDNLIEAQQSAMKIRKKVGGFPYLAETLRKAGVTQNIWNLPSCQSIYLTDRGAVVNQGSPLVTGTVDIPNFDRNPLIKALKADQSGLTTFPEFLKAAWEAGVVSYIVDFEKREVAYYGVLGESYSEKYPTVEINAKPV